jgi:hypothetical protein
MIKLFPEYDSIPDAQILPKRSYKSSNYENRKINYANKSAYLRPCYPACNDSQDIPNLTSGD